MAIITGSIAAIAFGSFLVGVIMGGGGQAMWRQEVEMGEARMKIEDSVDNITREKTIIAERLGKIYEQTAALTDRIKSIQVNLSRIDTTTPIPGFEPAVSMTGNRLTSLQPDEILGYKSDLLEVRELLELKNHPRGKPLPGPMPHCQLS